MLSNSGKTSWILEIFLVCNQNVRIFKVSHIFAKILDRLANPELLDNKGHFKNDRFAPTYFMGDGHQRVYRYLDDRVNPMGSFIKKARMKDVKS